MRDIISFSAAVAEKLQYYVYLLKDPETGQVFYVGKGAGDRIFAHLNRALRSPQASDKLDKIRAIQEKGLTVQHIIHRHGLTEEEAFEVESALIDFIGLDELTNMVRGYDSDTRGPMLISEAIALYDAPKIEIKEAALLIIVNRHYRRGMSAAELYEITLGNWVVGKQREQASYAFAVYRGIVREVYAVERWFPVTARDANQKTQQRWRFDGRVATELQHYVGGSVEGYLSLGAQNPIRYLNIK